MNELERLLNLSDYNIDFDDIQNNFNDLTRLAARIAGTDISLVNLIDSYTQWTVSSFGLEVKQVPRNESVCQYTIKQSRPLEVPDLSVDMRFKDFHYVKGDMALRYYFGIPLTTDEGANIGALCVMHYETRELSDEKIDSLKIIADEIVSRLRAIKVIEKLKAALAQSVHVQKKILHDVRGPVSGIIGVANIVLQQEEHNNMVEILEYMSVIKNSGETIIETSDQILTSHRQDAGSYDGNFTLSLLKRKLEELYNPSAINKGISLIFLMSEETAEVGVPKLNIVQIAGNLVSNAIKFTPSGGSVTVELRLEIGDMANLLHIRVKDSGIGLTKRQIDFVLNEKRSFTAESDLETEYMFGLELVKRLINSAHGELKIESVPGQGSTFEVLLLMI